MPRSIFLGRPWPAAGEPLFLPTDTAVALALHELEKAEAAERCPLCGMPRSVCRDKDNQFRFRAAAEQCHAAYALLAAQGASPEEQSRQSRQWSAYLHH